MSGRSAPFGERLTRGVRFREPAQPEAADQEAAEGEAADPQAAGSDPEEEAEAPG